MPMAKKLLTALIFLGIVLPILLSSVEDSILITVYVGDFCDSTVVSAPTKALPRHDFYVNCVVSSNADISDVNATLNCDDSWVFPFTEYPQLVNIGNMAEDESVTVRWMLVTPDEDDDYTLSVTVTWGAESYTTDEVTIQVDDDIYGLETTSTDISDDLYAYTDKTYSTQITTVNQNSIIYLRADSLTDNSYLDGYFHIVYDGETYDTIVDTIHKECAIINTDLCVEIDLSKVDGGKLRENGSYYIHMSAKDNLTVDSTRIYGTTQTFTYSVEVGHERIPETTVPPTIPPTTEVPAQAGFNPLFLLLGLFVIILGVAVGEFS